MRPAHALPAILLGWTFGVLIAGLVWWTIPYNGDPGWGVLIGCAAAIGVIAGTLVMIGAGRARRIGPVMMLTIPTAIMLRVSVDTAADPTSHNLWPFELVFGAGLATIGIFPAILLARILRRVTPARR